jgi:hypothetical protein
MGFQIQEYFSPMFDSTSQNHWMYQTVIVFQLWTMIRSKKRNGKRKETHNSGYSAATKD